MDKRNLVKVIGILSLCGGMLPAQADQPAKAAPESRMIAQLVTALSSESSQIGDTVRFTVVEPLIVEDRVLVDAGQELEGVVTVAQPSGRLGRAGRLGIEIKSESLNGANLPLQIVRPSAEGAKGKLGVLRRAAAPFAKVGRTLMTLGDRDTVQGQVANLTAVDPELARTLTTRAAGVADPLALVELASDKRGARIAKRGAKAIARLGGGYLNTLWNGPAGALHRGGSIEVPEGSLLHVQLKVDDEDGAQLDSPAATGDE